MRPDLDLMRALVARVESATGPCRELDAKIWLRIIEKVELGTCRDRDMICREPAFTASLDAALTLLPDGWVIGSLDWWPMRQDSGVTLFETTNGGFDASIHAQVRLSHRTPALTITAAALRAHLSQMERGDDH